MLQRQDSLRSSSHLETPTPSQHRHTAKPTGCFPAIFRLFSKHHSRKKLLTFGKKSPKNIAIPTQTELPESREDDEKHDLNTQEHDFEGKKLTASDVTPRSPMLRPEIRHLENGTPPPRLLVGRLMGLELENDDVVIHNEEKRKQLLDALEKCNKDLESLKKIIMAVQVGDGDGRNRRQRSEVFKPRSISGDESGDGGGGVSPWNRSNYAKLNSNVVMPQRKKVLGKKPAGEEDGVAIGFLNRIQAESFEMKRRATTPSYFWGSRAMFDSVEEVCNDVVWGQEREQVNLKMALHNYICRDLIEEVVFDLGFRRNVRRLPFEACRRRISF